MKINLEIENSTDEELQILKALMQIENKRQEEKQEADTKKLKI